MKYHVWTEGCQMNVADSRRVSAALESVGYQPAARVDDADVIILNTCVVRQSAEDKAYGRLLSLRPLKKQNPDLVIGLMGCLVGNKPDPKLVARFPFVDVFAGPSDPMPVMEFLRQKQARQLDLAATEQRFALMDEEIALPGFDQAGDICAYLPVVLGCSHACTYCVIPYRRGVEISRPFETVLAEARSLVEHGVKEITLLGQIVDRFGKDLPAGQNLPALLRAMNELDGLLRIRFLTSHPNWMTDELLETVAELPKVCPHIEVPIQAGDDQVLDNMKRGYTSDDYRQLVGRIRKIIPGVSIATDIIVGFPGETEEQFQHTYDLLEELRLDVAHLARYSSRPNTVATRRMVDDVTDEEKMRRFRLLEDQQERIATEIHARYLGRTVPVLIEAKSREKNQQRWRGRTLTNKLVFVESDADLLGREVDSEIYWTGPWSMIGTIKES
jgi:tRNA-2-methylthio-N6-dimethylallyladenosine synthase